MFQSKVFFEANTHNSGVRGGNPCSKRVRSLNSTLFPEGKGATATCLGNLLVVDRHKEINRKNAPNELFLVSNYKNQGR